MKLFNYELTDWYRGYGGLFKYDVSYVKDPKVAICLYHNLIEKESSSTIKLPLNSVYDPSRRIIWSVQFSHKAYKLTKLYNLCEPEEELNEDEITNKIDKFIERINKLKIFA